MIVAWRHGTSLAFQAMLAEKASGLAPEMRQILLRTHEIGVVVAQRRRRAGNGRRPMAAGAVRGAASPANDA